MFEKQAAADPEVDLARIQSHQKPLQGSCQFGPSFRRGINNPKTFSEKYATGRLRGGRMIREEIRLLRQEKENLTQLLDSSPNYEDRLRLYTTLKVIDRRLDELLTDE